jgi:hypothetical protein
VEAARVRVHKWLAVDLKAPVAVSNSEAGHGIIPLPLVDTTPRSEEHAKFTVPSMSDLIATGHIRPLCIRKKGPQTPPKKVPFSAKPSKHEIYKAMRFGDRSAASKSILRPGEDSFDPLEWSSDLPSTAASPDHSPEPVPIKPQPLTYTTVGSVVNPNVVPQFSAPNRIQREGANRRPLHTLLGTPRYEPLVQTSAAAASLPALNMANSMQYAQQIARSPVHITSSSSLSSMSGSVPRSTISTMPGPLAKHEELALLRNLLRNELQERSGNIPEETGSLDTFKEYPSSVNLPSEGIYTVKEFANEHGRSNSVPGFVQGLEKMQTLQRLAKFENPMRQLAIDRLSLFSVPKVENAGNSAGLTPQEVLLQNQIGMSKFGSPSNTAGELDLGYKFPPPGLAPPLKTQSGQSLARNPSQSTPVSARQGYPEPLTAGPPGQRQFPSQPSTNYSELWGDYGNYGNCITTLSWRAGYSYHAPVQPNFFPAHSGNVKSTIVDTLDPSAAAKYYSSGYPTDMGGHYQPLSEENTRFMEDGPSNLLPNAVKDARRDANTTSLIFEGQRRYTQMGALDYFEELVELQKYDSATKENSYGVIRPPKKKQLTNVEREPITDDDIKKKPIPEFLAPALDAVWGTLAGYRSVNCPGSNNDLSQFVCSPESLIDPEEAGNRSLFGEDWGKTATVSSADESMGRDA